MNNYNKYSGIGFNKERGKYLAQIRIDGKNKYLGYFTCPDKASQAYQTALKENKLVF